MDSASFHKRILAENLEQLRAREAQLEAAIAAAKEEMYRQSDVVAHLAGRLSDVKKLIGPRALHEFLAKANL